MIFGNYRFSCLFTDDAELPEFKGSTFRGVFGRALKNVVCALKRQECIGCLLNEKCLYSVVFETPGISKTNQGRIAAPPHPFVIEPPIDTITHYNKGDRFNFNLLLFGETNMHLPCYVYAFEEMGKTGIGRRADGIRGRFILEEVSNGDSHIYSNTDRRLRTDKEPDTISLSEASPCKGGDMTIKLLFLTPVRLKFENRLTAELPFHVLARAMLRRVSSLFSVYDGKEPELDYRGMVKRAEEVRMVKNELQWHYWRRYSFRQDQAMLLGGMTGSVTYSGALGEFIPLIELCARLHIGKQTTFGLGKFEASFD